MVRMGLQFGLEKEELCLKRKFRWLLKIDGVSASGVNALPPMKSSRPQMSFKEAEAEHLNETIHYPMKPEWKPITLVLYDLRKNQNPVFDWIKEVYDPQEGTWRPPVDRDFFKRARLELYDGCGGIMETWIYESAWPQAVEFGELDMANSEFVMLEVTLRYHRAFIQ